jgi:hypothetical protein
LLLLCLLHLLHFRVLPPWQHHLRLLRALSLQCLLYSLSLMGLLLLLQPLRLDLMSLHLLLFPQLCLIQSDLLFLLLLHKQCHFTLQLQLQLHLQLLLLL